MELEGNRQLELVKLAIPTGWSVVKNSFFDVDLPQEEEDLSASIEFVEDILALQQTCSQDPLDKKTYAIDLGWYPDHDPKGQYQLVLLQEDWDDILSTFQSRDRWAIRDQIEKWLQQVGDAKDRAQLESWLAKSERESENQ